MTRPTPEKGQVWQSRDDAYEPGRRIRVDDTYGEHASVTTIVSPRRPHRVGKTAEFLITNLQKRWRLVSDAETQE